MATGCPALPSHCRGRPVPARELTCSEETSGWATTLHRLFPAKQQRTGGARKGLAACSAPRSAPPERQQLGLRPASVNGVMRVSSRGLREN